MPIPLGLYIHIPWCERKCPYCDFNSHVQTTQVDESAYVEALLNDLRLDLHCYHAQLNGRAIDSIFIGGGTPSLFSESSIAKLLDGVRSLITVRSQAEITLEANPGSAESGKFAGFARAGINRLSLGVQSLDDAQLKTLGRVHSSEQALAAARMAAGIGIDFNIDLMYGLPHQSEQQAILDLTRAMELEPTHLSCYQLTIEPNTLFHLNPPQQPADDALWSTHLALKQALSSHGYKQYEVSAYAQESKQCQHNLNYWRFGDYLGIGAGAHGKISSADSGVARYWKIKHPATYTKRCLENSDAAGARTSVSAESLRFEFMLNALRLTDGFEPSLFESRTFLPFSTVDDIVQKHVTHGLLLQGDTRLKPTERGRAMVDSMLQDYLP